MPIRFHCEVCAARIKVPDGTVGKRVKCPGCGQAQRVRIEPEQSGEATPPEPVVVKKAIPAKAPSRSRKTQKTPLEPAHSQANETAKAAKASPPIPIARRADSASSVDIDSGVETDSESRLSDARELEQIDDADDRIGDESTHLTPGPDAGERAEDEETVEEDDEYADEDEYEDDQEEQDELEEDEEEELEEEEAEDEYESHQVAEAKKVEGEEPEEAEASEIEDVPLAMPAEASVEASAATGVSYVEPDATPDLAEVGEPIVVASTVAHPGDAEPPIAHPRAIAVARRRKKPTGPPPNLTALWLTGWMLRVLAVLGVAAVVKSLLYMSDQGAGVLDLLFVAPFLIGLVVTFWAVGELALAARHRIRDGDR